MFDNHPTPSIPPRAAPPARRPTRLARSCAMAALLGLPLILAAFMGSISLWTVLLLGLTQTALVAGATLLAARPAHAALVAARPARATRATIRQGFDHG